jgi:hypothetical protein
MTWDADSADHADHADHADQHKTWDADSADHAGRHYDMGTRIPQITRIDT